MEWQDNLISTDIDRLLKYLTDEKEASVSRIAEDLDIPEDQVKLWARSLEEAGMIEKSYSARRGTVLSIADVDRAKEKIEEVSDETQQELEQAADTIPEEVQELQEAQEKLRGLADALDEEIDIVQRYRKQLEALEEEEQAIREQIEDKDGKIAEEEEEALNALEDIEDELDAMEEEGLEAATFRDSKEKIQSNLQTLQTIADHIRNIEKQQEEEDSNTCVVCGRSFDSSRGLKIHQSQKHTEDEIEQARQEQDDDDRSNGLFGLIRDAVS